MQITFNTDSLTDADKALLRSILGEESATVAVQEPAKPAAKKAAPKPKPAPEPEPEPADDEDEDLVGGGATMEQATELATKLVGKGKAKAVKAALSKTGAKRVTEVDSSKIDEFVELLQDEDFVNEAMDA